MMFFRTILFFIFCFTCSFSFGKNGDVVGSGDEKQVSAPVTKASQDNLPAAPEGYRWMLIGHLSDEFNGEGLDLAKWQPRHPSWRGRDSRHESYNVSVQDGNLRLKSSLRENAEKVTAGTVTAACIASKKRECLPGYYETRIKASDLSMTSAFWFQGKKSEIDVIENFGRPTNVKKSSDEETMLMNTHYFNKGWGKDKSTPTKWKMPAKARDRFHVYGVWWKDAETVWMYHDNVKVAEIKTGGSFDEPQYMFFDTEVFSWNGWPTRESLLDPAKNTMLVDWVRSWKLEKIQEDRK